VIPPSPPTPPPFPYTTLFRSRAPSLAALATEFNAAFQLHLITRVRLIQRRYDMDTGHGTVAKYQRIWKAQMAACLANPRSDHLRSEEHTSELQSLTNLVCRLL